MNLLAWLMLGAAFALVCFTIFETPRNWLVLQFQ